MIITLSGVLELHFHNVRELVVVGDVGHVVVCVQLAIMPDVATFTGKTAAAASVNIFQIHDAVFLFLSDYIRYQ